MDTAKSVGVQRDTFAIQYKMCRRIVGGLTIKIMANNCDRSIITYRNTDHGVVGVAVVVAKVSGLHPQRTMNHFNLSLRIKLNPCHELC